MGELFTPEREISSAVSRASESPLPETEEKRLPEPGKGTPEAVDLYLRGLSHVLRDSEQDIDQAIALLEKSAALDSTFVPTQAYLARAYGNKSSIYRPNDPQWEEKGFAAVQKALMLDAGAPEAHYAQAIMVWRPSHGFQINPAHTQARFRIAPIKVYQQKFEEAITELNRVPRETFPAQWIYQRAWALISLDRLEEAERVVGEALQGNPMDQGGVLTYDRRRLRRAGGSRQSPGVDRDFGQRWVPQLHVLRDRRPSGSTANRTALSCLSIEAAARMGAHSGRTGMNGRLTFKSSRQFRRHD